jgi:hypothetical protein
MSFTKSIHRQLSNRVTYRKYAGLGFILAVILLAGLYRTPLHHAWNLATTHDNESYTELYFDNSSKLPLNVSTIKPATFSFHIANHEGATVTYQYAVTETIASITKTLSTGTLSLRDGKSGDVPIGFFLNKPEVAHIVVHLIAENETINFTSQS